jgi:hypothetical protein
VIFAKTLPGDHPGVRGGLIPVFSALREAVFGFRPGNQESASGGGERVAIRDHVAQADQTEAGENEKPKA